MWGVGELPALAATLRGSQVRGSPQVGEPCTVKFVFLDVQDWLLTCLKDEVWVCERPFLVGEVTACNRDNQIIRIFFRFRDVSA